MRVLIDYRPALRERSGVGEYAHQLVRAMLAAFPRNGTARALDVALFSSSWKDRLVPTPELAGADMIDRHVPVSVLNFAWHRLGWPAAETLAQARFDVTHSLHPLLLPARDAAQVITIHDLNFLAHPERTRAEIRRDYPRLARDHAHRADAIIAISEFTADDVVRRLGVAREKISVCVPGAPPWEPRAFTAGSGFSRTYNSDGYVLFVGTLEPRKNVGGLLNAYEQLVARRTDLPRLVLAGKAIALSQPWLDRIARAPLQRLVEHVGYIDPASRRELYHGARLLVQPSFDEGFGMPVLEAMTLGIPFVAASRGALPEVAGDAGLLVDPEDADAMAGAIERMIDDDALAADCAAKGIERAKRFSWERSAQIAYGAYQRAVAQRGCR